MSSGSSPENKKAEEQGRSNLSTFVIASTSTTDPTTTSTQNTPDSSVASQSADEARPVNSTSKTYLVQSEALPAGGENAGPVSSANPAPTRDSMSVPTSDSQALLRWLDACRECYQSFDNADNRGYIEIIRWKTVLITLILAYKEVIQWYTTQQLENWNEYPESLATTILHLKEFGVTMRNLEEGTVDLDKILKWCAEDIMKYVEYQMKDYGEVYVTDFNSGAWLYGES
ncbi:hypothetical protein B0O99DRAFT_691797 [Bisporella sp. PMI_857]|nr:hypothetical protein B0O99DRAFT_691797 [Bisporella sp. PMI_857]